MDDTIIEARPNEPLEADVITDIDASAAIVHVTIRGQRWSFVGSSKKHPEDRYDPTTGAMLALARAMSRAADKLEAEAMARTTIYHRLVEDTFRAYGIPWTADIRPVMHHTEGRTR